VRADSSWCIDVGVAPAPAAPEKVPLRWKNCTIVNKRFRIAGKLRARRTRPYLEAMRFNSRFDRDKDGIACEKL